MATKVLEKKNEKLRFFSVFQNVIYIKFVYADVVERWWLGGIGRRIV